MATWTGKAPRPLVPLSVVALVVGMGTAGGPLAPDSPGATEGALPLATQLLPPSSGGFGLGAAGTVQASQGQVTTNPLAQDEPVIAVNPANPDELLVGWNDFDSAALGASVWVGVGNSHDGGETWNSRLLAPQAGDPTTAPCSVPSDVTHAADPMAAFNARGVGLVGHIIRCDSLRSSLVVRSTQDGGDSFSTAVYPARAFDNVPPGLTDKPWLRGDSLSDWFFLCWTHHAIVPGFTNSGDAELYFSASPDGQGAVWTPPKPITLEGFPQGCDIGIGAAGTVYVAYTDYGDLNEVHPTAIKVIRSLDHGLSFGLPITVSQLPVTTVPNAKFRLVILPRIDVNPNDGTVYLVWTEGAGGDIMFSKSVTGGLTWSPKRVVNNDVGGRSQIFPSVASAPDGTLHVGFYDRRDDPANRVFRYYLASSTDHGETFPTQAPAGESSFDGLDPKFDGFIGDYTDLRVGSDGVPHAVWTATDSGNQDIYTNPSGP